MTVPRYRLWLEQTGREPWEYLSIEYQQTTDGNHMWASEAGRHGNEDTSLAPTHGTTGLRWRREGTYAAASHWMSGVIRAYRARGFAPMRTGYRPYDVAHDRLRDGLLPPMGRLFLPTAERREGSRAYRDLHAVLVQHIWAFVTLRYADRAPFTSRDCVRSMGQQIGQGSDSDGDTIVLHSGVADVCMQSVAAIAYDYAWRVTDPPIHNDPVLLWWYANADDWSALLPREPEADRVEEDVHVPTPETGWQTREDGILWDAPSHLHA